MKELQAIVAILNERNDTLLFEDYLSDFFPVEGQLLQDVKDYYFKYDTLPTVAGMGEKYPELLDTNADRVAREYVEELREQFLERKVSGTLTNGVKNIQSGAVNPSEALQILQNVLSDYNKYTANSVVTDVMDFDIAEEHYEEVRKRIAENGGVSGIGTGFDFFDSAYPTGMQAGDLIVVLGWTGRAKSFFTTYVACHAFKEGRTPMIASLEMNADKIRDRVWATMGAGMFRNTDLVMGDIEEDKFNQFRSHYESEKKKFLIVESDGRSELTPAAMQVKYNQYHPDLMIWDYAQIMSDNEGSENVTQKMKNLSTQAKQFAVRNQIPVILISSATPDGKVDDIPPTIEQVAWSKQLAYDADLAVAVHKQTDSNIIDIVCRKNRNGPEFAGSVKWDLNQGIIEEL